MFGKTKTRQAAGLEAELVKLSLRALWLKDRPTYAHSLNVARYATALALAMGRDQEELALIWTGALLHDIGKLYLSETLLNGNSTKLTLQERDSLQEHAVIGFELFRVTPISGTVLDIIRHHHERWDGLGYPDRLRGAAIPLHARIVAVCDAFEAMTQGRSYQPSRSEVLALEELRDNATFQFCPDTVSAFTQMCAQGKLHVFREAMPSSRPFA